MRALTAKEVQKHVDAIEHDGFSVMENAIEGGIFDCNNG